MRTTRPLTIAVAVFAAASALAACYPLSGVAAGGLLHPARRHLKDPAPPGCDDGHLQAGELLLAGWRCRAAGERRGTLVYLHGIADNRSSARGIIQRYTSRGLDVFAYDSRAHGESAGDTCTYGFFEKGDLRRIIDTAEPGPVILFGTSLGAAVAVQEAADDARVSGIVAAEIFSDLRTVARERAPFFLSAGTIDEAFRIAERDGQFKVDAVSPMAAASRISVPVLLIHGAEDKDTPPAHSERVMAALRGPKHLILVPGVGHNRSLSGDVWGSIDRWIDEAITVHH